MEDIASKRLEMSPTLPVYGFSVRAVKTFWADASFDVARVNSTPFSTRAILLRDISSDTETNSW